MKMANGVSTVYKRSGNRRNPYIVRKTVGWDIDTQTGKRKQIYITIGYAPTRAKGLEMLMDYNKNPNKTDHSAKKKRMPCGFRKTIHMFRLS